MNVSLITLLNATVAAAISFGIEQNLLDKKNETTAWFLRIMYKWFKYMTGRYYKYAISHHNEEEYTEATACIESVMDIFRTMKVSKSWKPYQTYYVAKQLWTFKRNI
ncbi:hypothetical protein Zmor_005944 [Zophobas morio]|uniref:Uncharacterized protein n=1 Tax=Zophobas morio TaxID=2755281 RepID=A0AA38MMY1_9CUCU|nr:hypothetical protein Zmor_005944 [Zophobas morio]